MAGQLLVRMYNVGLGDCIYLRVPDADRNVHILIDCGNKFDSLDLLGQRITELKPLLPDAPGGKKHLDLLVVSHPHEDHHKGFEEDFFGDLQIDHIWLSPAFNLEDPNSKGFHALKDASRRALLGLAGQAFGDTAEQVRELLRLTGIALGDSDDPAEAVLSLTKDEALTMLNTKLPGNNHIDPLYVSTGTPKEKLFAFHDPQISLKVLAPMEDVDGYYLGGEGQPSPASGASPNRLADGYQSLFPPPEAVKVEPPSNISSGDFRQLRGQVRAGALAAAELAGHIENNLSVVLLLEWHDRRLLFPGDAEWTGAYDATVKKGRSNSSWNVMWKECRQDLSKPLDFLKIGHHGSVNATPWSPPDSEGKPHPISEILDALLPRPPEGQKPKAYAVASTRRTQRWPTIPDATLIGEIGKRIANARTQYVETGRPQCVPAGVPQPQRTDLEAQVAGTPDTPVPYIDITFDPQ